MALLRVSCLVLIAAITGNIQAAIVYDESLSGDFSNTGLTATALGAITSGSNTVMGSTGSGATGVDRDYFTFTIAAGFQLDALVLLPGTMVGGPVAFIGLQAGTQVTLPTSPPDASGLLGWHHYSSSDIGQNILINMSVPAFGSSGFSIPLTAGSYAVWIQDFSPGPLAYGLDFSVSAAVPEPGTIACLLSGLTAMRAVRRRKVRS